jgi:hypothetical protein
MHICYRQDSWSNKLVVRQLSYSKIMSMEAEAEVIVGSVTRQ